MAYWQGGSCKSELTQVHENVHGNVTGRQVFFSSLMVRVFNCIV